MSDFFRRSLLASTLLGGALVLATPAAAQQAGNQAGGTSSDAQQPGVTPTEPDASTDREAVEQTSGADIVVTGSRIVRPDLVASSPIVSLGQDMIKQNNTVTVEQLLNQNPQFVANDTSASNNPGDGAATIDLRGLGSQRTLVLVDGKRVPGFDTSGAVDVNAIPTALIKRIDILTGGASAVYGSDAVSGVVNFVLDDRFVGLRADAASQISSRGDGHLYDASLTGGIKLGDRGNLIVSGNYSNRGTVRFGDRPHNANALDSSDLVSSGGSSNTVPTAFDLPGQGRFQVTDSGALTNNVQLYNFTPVNYAQIPLERYSVTGLARYELTDGIEAYGRASYEHLKSETNLASTATAGFTFNIDPTNPFLTAAERAAFFNRATAVINNGSGVAADPTARAGTSVVGIRRRIVETGGRNETHETEAYQFVGGFRGDVGGHYKYDVFAQYGEVKRDEVLRNDLSYTALQQALDVVAGPAGPRCFDTSNGCVPLNLFTTAAIPQNQLAFVLRDAMQNTKTTQFVAGASLSGDLGFLKSPFADAPAAVSVGGEYRRETARTLVDPNFASGDLIYYGQGQNIAGRYNVKEGYVEVKAPLVQDRPFFHALDLEAGYRYSDYSTAGGVSTYKGGGDWSPVEGVRFRGIYQRAVRAPSVNELFSPVVGGTGSLNTDPCAGTGVSATIRAICTTQGAPANAVIPQPISGQINVFTGGNTNLDAEKTDTYTAGVVLTPKRLRNFSLAVDYYNIKIGNAIATVSPSIIVNQCYFVDQSASSAACAGIRRNTLDGSLSGNLQFGVPQQLGNIAVISTDGIDVSSSYHGGDAAGFNYAFTFFGTYTDSYKQQLDPTSPSVECAGRFGSACNIEPIPTWRHTLTGDFGYGGVTFATRWRFLGRVKQDVGTDILRSRIPSFTYIDETVNIAVNDAFNFRVGAQNVFDKKSPIVGDTVGADPIAGSTYPNTYDVIGRTFFAGLSAKF